MNARQIHAVLAAGVDNPALISAWRSEPARLPPRHRTWQPGPRRIVEVRGLDDQGSSQRRAPAAPRHIPAHGGRRAGDRSVRRLCRVPRVIRQSYAAATTERTHDVVQFIAHWIDPSVDIHALRGDIVRHEQALVLLNDTEADVVSGAGGAPAA